MPHCSSLWLPYPTDLCFLRIPLCPPHQAAHIPMSRQFFHFSVFRPCLQPSRSFLFGYRKNQNNRSGSPISGFHCFDNTRALRYKFGNQINKRGVENPDSKVQTLISALQSDSCRWVTHGIRLWQCRWFLSGPRGLFFLKSESILG